MVDWNNDDDKIFGVVRIGVVKVAAVLLFSLVAMWFCTAYVSAEPVENTTPPVANGSYVVVETISTPIPTETPTPIPTELAVGRRISQGECVVPGETIDIAGIGWYTGTLTYYGRYYDWYAGAGNSSVVAIYSVSTQDLDHFYVEPGFFSQHLGWWYLVDTTGDTGDSHGNDQIFYVADTCHTEKENVTIVQEAINETIIRQAILANMTHLPVKTEPGISLIVSRNTTSTFAAPTNSRYWVFGPDSGGRYYDREEVSDGFMMFDTAMVNDLNDAVYSVIFVQPGINTITEETYDSEKNALSSPFRSPADLDLTGLDQSVVRDRLIGRIGSSRDDSYVEWRVSLQDPEILIMKFSQESLGNNQSYVAISGYTNANIGEDITILLDEDKINAITRSKSTWHATVVDNGGAVAYRTWNTSFIIDFNNAFPGQHEITAVGETGARASVPLYFRNELPGHYIPPDTINFVDNSPFIPTPTPEIIVKEVPGPVVTKIVTVTITPSEQQIQKAGEGVAKVWVIVGVILLAILAAIGAFALWMKSVYRRTKI